MPGWLFARDVPGLLSPGRVPPAMPPRQGVSFSAASGQPGGAFAIDFSIWEMLGRLVVFFIGYILVIPAPWVVTNFYGWLISRIHVPQRGQLGFTGKPLDIWYVFVGLALLIYSGQTGIRFIEILVFPLQAVLSWLVVRWVVANISAQGQPLKLNFAGSALTYTGWYLLFYLSFITIVGWAWVLTAWMRWHCANVEGTRRIISFNATGLEMLWRTLVFSIACAFIIPIPWMLGWYGRWYVAQFSASERA